MSGGDVAHTTTEPGTLEARQAACAHRPTVGKVRRGDVADLVVMCMRAW